MNNPFTNNRFQCLEEESSSKFYSNKKYKKQESYDSNKNSFIKDREKTRTNYGENTIVENKKKNKFVKEMEKEKEEIKFNIKEFEFPEIGKVVSNNTNNIINFKDAINKVTSFENDQKEANKIKPGWVEISKVNGRITIKEGPLTPYLEELNRREEYENTPHYIMNKAVTSILLNRNKYIQEYNSIHGEGAYEELYILPPVYGPEYDTEEESDNSLESDENE